MLDNGLYQNVSKGYFDTFSTFSYFDTFSLGMNFGSARMLIRQSASLTASSTL